MRSHLVRLLTFVVSAAMIALFGWVGAGIATAAPPGAGGKNTVQVTGTGPNGEKFTGQFTAKSAQADQSAPTGVALVGDLTGQLMPAQAQGPKPGQGPGTGPGRGNVSQQNVAMPVANISVPQQGEGVAAQQAVCNVLDLTLGPLDLNLLGLIVHLDTVHLVIDADPNGGLLGSLLCGLAGGPSGPAPVQTIIDLLNQILGILGGL